jgi:hypothetical protein
VSTTSVKINGVRLEMFILGMWYTVGFWRLLPLFRKIILFHQVL